MKANDGFWLHLVSKHGKDDWEGAANRGPLISVVDDDPATRELLTRMLEPLGIPVQTYASAEEFLASFDSDQPGCLVLDLRLPGMDGFALFNALRALGALLPVIFVTGYADVATARYALLAGAADFLEKPVDRRNLLTAVRTALDNDGAKRRTAAVGDRLTSLTTREWDVLRLVVAGKANKVIGYELEISQKTVEAHRSRVMSKSGAESVADLVRMFSAYEASNSVAAEPEPIAAEAPVARLA